MTSQMEQEARQAPQVIAQQLRQNRAVITALSQRLRQSPPSFAMTIGRGSSDHAATYAKYLFESYLGVVTASAAPSVLTLYGSELSVRDGLVVGISQSGQSEDICEMMQAARRGGAITVAVVNQLASPLAQAAEYVLPLWAGEEKAVAATKSYLASLAALLDLVSAWSENKALKSCSAEIPQRLASALEMNWQTLIAELYQVEDTFIIARGFGFPLAQEAALKLKETCLMHGEAFSSAEVLHGPFALVRDGYPMLFFCQGDDSAAEILTLAKKVQALGGRSIIAMPENLVSRDELEKAELMCLPLPQAFHPACDALMVIQAFYPAVAQLALKRGYDPDKPKHLTKVTRTR